MRPRRRLLLGLAAAVLVVLVGMIALVHLPPVQDRAWRRVVAAVEASTGWRAVAEDVALRGFPARLVVRGLTLSAGDRPALTVERLEARWSWWRLLRSPHRLESLVIEGPVVDTDALPSSEESTDDRASIDLFESFEVGSLRLVRGRAVGGFADLDLELDGLALEAGLTAGRAVLEGEVGKLAVSRESRVLELGSARLRVRASRDGVTIESLTLAGDTVFAEAAGVLRTAPGPAGRLEIRLGGDLAALAGWWDPDLASGFSPEGRLELRGSLVLEGYGNVELELEHRGGPLRVAGYDLEILQIGYHGGRPSATLAGSGWGTASLSLRQDGAAEVAAELREAPVDGLLSFVAPAAASRLRGPVTLSGTFSGTASVPVDPSLVAGRGDLVLASPDGRLALAGEGAGRAWQVRRFDLASAELTASGSGRVEADGSLKAEVHAAVARPERLAAIVQERLRLDRLPAIGGGPLALSADLSGTVAAPLVVARLEWDEPELAGQRLQGATVTAEGDLEELAWALDLELARGSRLQSSGTAQLAEGNAEGSWSVSVTDPAALAVAVAPDLGLELGGRLEGEGTLRLAGGQPEVEGRVEGWSLAAGPWRVDRLSAVVQADTGSVEVRELELALLGGSLGGELRLGLLGAEPDLRAHLAWQGFETAVLPVAVPEAAAGRSDGWLRVQGPLGAPEIEAELGWTSSQPAPLVEHVGLRASLRGGVLEAATTGLRSELGSASASFRAPLGGFARPAWLWPAAPAGAVVAQVAVEGFRARPLVESLGLTEGVDVAGDLQAELRWDPADADRPWARVELTGLRISHPSGDLVAQGPVVARLDGGRIEIEPLVLSGLGSRFELEALSDPATNEVAARLRALISEDLARLVPLPLELRGAITVEGELRVPAGEDLPAGLSGTLRVDHRDGALVLRDPPLEVRGLNLGVEIGGGSILSVDGAALVNGGTVDFGGGWDPATGQGLVLDLQDVTFLIEGILTKWDGELAIEPRPDLIAEVVGELELTAGLWDESFAITGALLGGEELQLASDDPLYSIGLDLTVRGRSGIEVDNNLGRFNASWDLLEIGGTLAAPRLRGEVRIASGGTLALAGQEIRVSRGGLRFTGDPAVDPILEIVPESDLALSEGDFDATLAATRGLAGGLSSALGFENTTLRPAEIAVQTEKDPSTRFMVGRRLSSRLALFLATDLTDVQDRTTMLQAWNFPGARGLVLQAYQETLNDEAGANLLQRFTWGGSQASGELPELSRLKLEGEWPVSKRELRRATRLRRGQPYDPFLLFVASVRLERALAGAGYQSARVEGREEGEPRQPTLVFGCEPGPRTPFEFEGDVPSRRLRSEATALYRPPPLEDASLVAIGALLERQLAAEGFPDPSVKVTREEAAVRVVIERGPELRLAGPVLVGLPLDAKVSLGPALSSPAALAVMGMDGPWAAAVERELAAFGFHEARVLAIERVPTTDRLAEVRVEVDPGPRAVIDGIRVAGDDPLGLAAADAFRLRVGDPLDRPAIEHVLRELRGAYIEAGYREAEVRSAVREDAEVGSILEVEIAPGRQRSLRQIRVHGVRHTSPEVLARGAGLEPGAVVTDRSLDLGVARIANFEPIARVDVRAEPVGATGLDLDLEVAEKARWTAELGGGWSSERGASASFGLRDDNLVGRGLGLSLRGSWSAPERGLILVGSLPPLPGGRLSLIATTGYREGEAPDLPDLLEQEELLASIEAQVALDGGVQLGLYYRWTDTRTFEKEPDPFFPLDITVGLGVLGARAIVDRFDDLFDPRTGWGLTSDLGWSSESVGSDFEYLSSLTNLSFALTPFAGATWVQTARIGIAEPLKDQNLIRDVRFFAGGQSSVRGFDLNSVGPVTFGPDFSLVPAGGGALFVLNEELRVPIWGSLRAALFTDFGQVWESWSEADGELSIGVGLGLRWSTPIGPLWVDVAWPVANIGISSDKPKFYFGIGRPF